MVGTPKIKIVAPPKAARDVSLSGLVGSIEEKTGLG
jgi:hypothetical protein